MESDKPAETYLLGHSAQETQRLMTQARWLDLPLRRFFEAAGVRADMRVLDIGSGAGDVALTAADLVGPGGAVVGVELNPQILETARQRAREARLANVTFAAGDIRDGLALAGEFDALVGRFVLQYLPEPGPMLRDALGHLRSGGIVAFQEGQLEGLPLAYPPSPLLERRAEWIRQVQARSGADPSAGLALHRTFLEAGLPTPEMRADAFVMVGADGAWIDWLVASLRPLLPRILDYGIATAEEIDIETWGQRCHAEFASAPRAAIPLICISAWARKP
jgi:SAM-dependent methyltransferase